MLQHYHDEDDSEDRKDCPILLNAVVTWFRVYQVPFDLRVADVLCTVAIALYFDGIGERQITDHLIRKFNGPMATMATAASSLAYH
jgi:hypothetical protein